MVKRVIGGKVSGSNRGMELETLSLDVTDGIARVTLTRGSELNTMNEAFWREMREVFARIEADPAARAVLLASTGRHFTAGLDLKWAAAGGALGGGAGDEGRRRLRFRRHVKELQDSFTAIDDCKVPVIAVIQGGCIGGGVDLASACDIRIGTADCFFTIQEINIGIVADVGTLQRLPYLLPQGLVRELAFTGRRFPAAEAVRYGFLNSVHDSHAAALAAGEAIAREIAQKSPVAVQGTKAVLNRGRDQTIAEGLDYVAVWNAAYLAGEDLAEAMAAQMQKRPASFKDVA
jgi:enoyl-CoA hydratase